MKRIVSIVAGLALACVYLNASDVGGRFPDFTLKDTKGRPTSLQDFQGKILVVNLWMTTCPPCRKEMPMLQRIHEKYADRGVVVLGISADNSAKIVERFAQQFGITYTLLLNPQLYTEESERKLGFNAFPTTFVVDGSGIVRKKIVGFNADNDVERAVLELLPK